MGAGIVKSQFTYVFYFLKNKHLKYSTNPDPQREIELMLETCINAFENTPTNEQIVGRNEN